MDGQLELMCALVQGTGLYACNRFYQAEVENGKKALDVSICWKSLYEEEIAEKKVQGWFLLLAESLEGAV